MDIASVIILTMDIASVMIFFWLQPWVRIQNKDTHLIFGFKARQQGKKICRLQLP